MYMVPFPAGPSGFMWNNLRDIEVTVNPSAGAVLSLVWPTLPGHKKT